MNEKRYMISDAAKKVEVETHVLRYWEEELELTISRNEMGHRYYTEEDIFLFSRIKEMKEKGYQLKAIKGIVPQLKHAGFEVIEPLLEEQEEETVVLQEKAVPDTRTSIIEMPKRTQVVKPGLQEDKVEQFQMILESVMRKVIQENNDTFGKEVGARVSDHVLKELDYLSRVQDEREEVRYKKLDELIRNYQAERKEAGVGKKKKEKERKEKKHRLFGRRKKKEEGSAVDNGLDQTGKEELA